MKHLNLFEIFNNPKIETLKIKEPKITIECDHNIGEFDEEDTLTQKTTIHYKKGDRLTLNNYHFLQSGNLPKMYPIEGGGWISIEDILNHFNVI